MITRHELLEFTAGGVAFYYAQQVYRRVYAWYIHRKFDREYREAQERMRDCLHTETAVIDTGMGLDGLSRKCRQCWAIRIGDSPWNPNSAPWSSYDAQGYPLYEPHTHGGPRDVSGR